MWVWGFTLSSPVRNRQTVLFLILSQWYSFSCIKDEKNKNMRQKYFLVQKIIYLRKVLYDSHTVQIKTFLLFFLTCLMFNRCQRCAIFSCKLNAITHLNDIQQVFALHTDLHGRKLILRFFSSVFSSHLFLIENFSITSYTHMNPESGKFLACQTQTMSWIMIAFHKYFHCVAKDDLKLKTTHLIKILLNPSWYAMQVIGVQIANVQIK